MITALLWSAFAAMSSACSGVTTIELLNPEAVNIEAGRDERGAEAPSVPIRNTWLFPPAEASGQETDPKLVDSDGDGFTDAEEIFLGSDPMGEGGTCANGSYSAVQRKRAVDIMLVVDNSGSMEEYIQAIVARINQDFAAILAAAEVDYRVIVLSRHGAIAHDSGNECDDHGICIEPPWPRALAIPTRRPRRPSASSTTASASTATMH